MQPYSMHAIRMAFAQALNAGRYTTVNREGTMTALTGNTTVEIVGASFLASDHALFGEVNWNYVLREEEWYNSMSLNVKDIPGETPAVWKAVADKDGFINSNYGWCIYSTANVNNIRKKDQKTKGGRVLNQYNLALEELQANPESRRACMIYTRPQMWADYNRNGRSDFMCTNTVQYLIRNGQLDAVVQMRSNDAVLGFKNDRAWQDSVLKKLAAELNVPKGMLYWNVGSLHVYAKHYYLVDHFNKTSSWEITLNEYKQLYPDSPYA